MRIIPEENVLKSEIMSYDNGTYAFYLENTDIVLITVDELEQIIRKNRPIEVISVEMCRYIPVISKSDDSIDASSILGFKFDGRVDWRDSN